jgi:2-phosphosulfolactate phosphatase
VFWRCHDCFHGMREEACAGGIAVVLDVLRASTTIITALAHGAAWVLPVRTIEEAREAAAREAALLGGERGGRRIDGFSLGNSPLEYTADRLGGRPVVITTTNGTAALHACGAAAEVLVGGIVNRAAVAACARQLAAAPAGREIHLVCAGTDGVVTEEDLLGAGAILDAAVALPGAAADDLDPAARAALARYRETVANADPASALARAFASTLGGRNLLEIGMQADLPPAAAIDSFAVVPRFDRVSGRLVAEPASAG